MTSGSIGAQRQRQPPVLDTHARSLTGGDRENRNERVNGKADPRRPRPSVADLAAQPLNVGAWNRDRVYSRSLPTGFFRPTRAISVLTDGVN